MTFKPLKPNFDLPLDENTKKRLATFKMTDIKLSYSGWTTYMTCPRKWRLHYQDKIRPVGDSSPLIFGRAIDEALNALLLKETKDPLKVFQDFFTWEQCENITWLKNDLDRELFTEEQVLNLTGMSVEYVTWACMRIKGRLMLEAYIREALPRITEVHSVQLETKPRPGFIDAVLSIDKDTKYIVDHKTTSRPYQGDSVRSSSQLALYAGATGISNAAYITLVKVPRKNKRKTCTTCGKDGSGTAYKTCHHLDNGTRCHGAWDIVVDPEAICQVITDKIPKREQEIISNSLDETVKLIKTGHFPMNLSACAKMFGKPCPYFEYCRTKNMAGLSVKKENK